MCFSSKRIAVIGGGLGGMAFMNSALYSSLANVHLYESVSQLSEVGAGVTITSNANRVLDAVGLREAMLEKSRCEATSFMEYRHFRTGDFLGQIDEWGSPKSRWIHRAHLLEILHHKIPDDHISFGKHLRQITWTPERKCYMLFFADESSAEADIVVGCDGIKSVVRAHLGLKDNPIYSRQMVYRGFVSYDELSPATAVMLRKMVNFRGPRRHLLTLPIGNDAARTAQVGVIAFMPEPLEGWTSESWLTTVPVDHLHEHVKDWSGPVQDIITGLRKSHPDGRILKQSLFVREPCDKWFDARADVPGSGIVLLGDSVHSTLPHQGQGACQAIESGFALAQILRLWKDDSDLGAALQFFQDFRKPRTDRVTRSSYETGKMASADIPEHEWASVFIPSVVRERMRWVMEYDLLGELMTELQKKNGHKTDKTQGAAATTADVAIVVS